MQVVEQAKAHNFTAECIAQLQNQLPRVAQRLIGNSMPISTLSCIYRQILEVLEIQYNRPWENKTPTSTAVYGDNAAQLTPKHMKVLGLPKEEQPAAIRENFPTPASWDKAKRAIAAAIKQMETPDGAEIPKREMPGTAFKAGSEMHRQMPSFEQIKQAQQQDAAVRSAAEYVIGGKVKSKLPLVHPEYP